MRDGNLASPLEAIQNEQLTKALKEMRKVRVRIVKLNNMSITSSTSIILSIKFMYVYVHFCNTIKKLVK